MPDWYVLHIITLDTSARPEELLWIFDPLAMLAIQAISTINKLTESLPAYVGDSTSNRGTTRSHCPLRTADRNSAIAPDSS